MEEEIANVQTRLTTYKESHPNLYMFWNEYVHLKTIALKNTIQELNKVLELIGSMPDFDTMTLITMYCISRETP